ncbi:pyrroline-5-carboxylate reductase [Neobacillus bataviensis LMG 21833]|uniref:Pyrroline-5-carboxylate reductase n=2 Tax=Neobacillus bataviensis TaxID=220685 RepID=K6DNF1_9BACI|nr:pyrroline-5-carboxylate reductase [Neobacillus bataviensis LMG 21833]
MEKGGNVMKKIAIVGAGSMAEALISGILEDHLIDRKNIWVTNNSNEKRLESLKERYGISSTYDLDTLFDDADVVMLAMKPKDADRAIMTIRHHLTEQMLVVSVLAGVSMNTIESLAEKSLSIARAMPNTSAAVGKSATAIAINSRVTDKQHETTKQLFATVGLARFVEEEQLDAVTGLSGSGPAYIYYLIEAMENSAAEIGLEKEMAQELIVQTLIGAAEMVKHSSKSPEQLRREVTSPGGTTEAGVKVLEEHGVQQAFISCIQAATAQSKKMGNALCSQLKVGKPS